MRKGVKRRQETGVAVNFPEMRNEVSSTLEFARCTGWLILSNIDLQRKAKQDAERITRLETDALTGLLGANLFEEHLPQRLKRATREKTKVALIYIDGNGMKKANDTYGHAHGDLLIGAIANGIFGTIRPGDTGYRWGGDEFSIIMDVGKIGQKKQQELEVELYGRVKDSVAKSIDEAGLEGSVSVGVCVSRLGEDAEELRNRADLLMYADKAQTREENAQAALGA